MRLGVHNLSYIATIHANGDFLVGLGGGGEVFLPGCLGFRLPKHFLVFSMVWFIFCIFILFSLYGLVHVWLCLQYEIWLITYIN